jgi:Domain of unknown function (DUF4123)
MKPDELTNALESERAARPGDNAFLLIDPMAGLPAGPVLEELRLRHAVRVPLPGRSDIDIDSCCVLVQLTDGFDELLYLSARLSCKKTELNPDDPWQHHLCASIGGWLLSDSSADALAQHLSRCMNQRDRSGVPRYVRLADPRVLSALWPAMSSEQKRQLLGPITAWWAITWQGELIKCSSPASVADGVGQTTLPKPTKLILSWDQWAQLGRMASAHSALQRWLSRNPELRDTPVDDSEHALHRIDAAVARAQILGFTERDDLIAFSISHLQGLDQGKTAGEFNAAVQQALRDLRPLDYCLADAAMSIP